jgi:hypothetical protein
MTTQAKSRKHCCKEMEKRLFTRLGKGSVSEAPENRLVLYVPPFQEYGLPINDGGGAFILIKYCPWCGAKLPKSKRSSWVSKMSKLGYTTPLSDDVPDVYLTEEWEEYLPKKTSNKKLEGHQQ